MHMCSSALACFSELQCNKFRFIERHKHWASWCSGSNPISPTWTWNHTTVGPFFPFNRSSWPPIAFCSCKSLRLWFFDKIAQKNAKSMFSLVKTFHYNTIRFQERASVEQNSERNSVVKLLSAAVVINAAQWYSSSSEIERNWHARALVVTASRCSVKHAVNN